MLRDGDEIAFGEVCPPDDAAGDYREFTSFFNTYVLPIGPNSTSRVYLPEGKQPNCPVGLGRRGLEGLCHQVGHWKRDLWRGRRSAAQA